MGSETTRQTGGGVAEDPSDGAQLRDAQVPVEGERLEHVLLAQPRDRRRPAGVHGGDPHELRRMGIEGPVDGACDLEIEMADGMGGGGGMG